MSCYERFHWSHEQVRKLPLQEAELLAVYFEEVAAFEKRQAEKRSRTSSEHVTVVGSENEEYLFEDVEELERILPDR